MVKHDLWIEREIFFPLVISPSPLALPDRYNHPVPSLSQDQLHVSERGNTKTKTPEEGV